MKKQNEGAVPGETLIIKPDSAVVPEDEQDGSHLDEIKFSPMHVGPGGDPFSFVLQGARFQFNREQRLLSLKNIRNTRLMALKAAAILVQLQDILTAVFLKITRVYHEEISITDLQALIKPDLEDAALIKVRAQKDGVDLLSSSVLSLLLTQKKLSSVSLKCLQDDSLLVKNMDIPVDREDNFLFTEDWRKETFLQIIHSYLVNDLELITSLNKCLKDRVKQLVEMEEYLEDRMNFQNERTGIKTTRFAEEQVNASCELIIEDSGSAICAQAKSLANRIAVVQVDP